MSFATPGANSLRGVPSSAPPSERFSDASWLLDRYVTGFRHLTAVYLKGRTGTSDGEDPVCLVECA
jgi:hypothetical protein